MDAIALLNEQHDEVDELFAKAEKARNPETKRRLFVKLADALAMHAAIEEKIFYPAVNARRTEDLLLEALEELAEAMNAMMEEMEGHSPRNAIRSQTRTAAPLP